MFPDVCICSHISTVAHVDLLAMPSPTDLAKRDLVKVLRELAVKYGVALSLTRESANKEVEKAFRKVSFKAHPDKGGLLADFQRLSATNDKWQMCCSWLWLLGGPREVIS